MLQIWDLSVTLRISLVTTRNGNGYFYPTRPVFARFPSKVSAFACVTRPLSDNNYDNNLEIIDNMKRTFTHITALQVWHRFLDVVVIGLTSLAVIGIIGIIVTIIQNPSVVNNASFGIYG